MTETMKKIVLAKRPEGMPTEENFRLEEAPLPELQEGEVLVAVRYMSLDPYMRGRMDDAESYASPVPLGGTMEAGTVGEVIESRSDRFAKGDMAFGMFGWATHGVLPAKQLRKIDPDAAPISTSLGVLGMPGFTAWAGITAYGALEAGQTVVVGAATGPVGSMVGQLAKLKGCRVVGVAGGPEKCKMAVETFGFDACVDHRAHGSASEMRAALAAECPDGVDLYFENVGGPTLGGVLPLMKIGGRIIVCGMIAWYNGATDETGQIPLGKFWRRVLVKRLQIFGLLQTDHVARFGEFVREIAPKVKSGEIAYVEDVAEGLENAPEAFRALLTGGNTGKQVVKIS
ncbi:NADP-dependent oxidoreductase [Pseudooceanicola aestuarii]|uniref:NADP-dependent oxidoreductase n=1 Tax=Pseudooceanicola aestuarii TaxID=2697319 RepID=UPI0013D2FDBF|nr:NADP-dependent oxidoreductase [Pseudooceanicola aestuarii]